MTTSTTHPAIHPLCPDDRRVTVRDGHISELPYDARYCRHLPEEFPHKRLKRHPSNPNLNIEVLVTLGGTQADAERMMRANAVGVRLRPGRCATLFEESLLVTLADTLQVEAESLYEA